MRLSATMSLQPRSCTLLMMRVPMSGCCSVVFEPMTRMQSAFSMQAMVFVIAPDPRLASRPMTVDEWQRRAQWSMLLVLKTARASFIIA